MSLLRRVLQVKAINHSARAVGRAVMPAARYKTFDRRLPLVDPFDFRLPDGKQVHWLPHGDRVSKFLRYDGWDGYEGPTARLFYALARHARVVFDVGAYLGYFAALGAVARDGNRAFAFEAVPVLAEHCREMVAANPGLAIEVVAAAVGKTDGTTEIYLDVELTTDASTDPDFRPGRKPVTVQAVRLDQFVWDRGLDALDLLKIDTESTEPDVLEGMAECVERFRPSFVIEVLPLARVAALDEFLRANDYACATIQASGVSRRASVVPVTDSSENNYLLYPATPVNAVAAAAHSLVTS